MAITHVGRDPFARGDYRRESFAGDDRKACGWCGQKKKTMFHYEWKKDSPFSHPTGPNWASEQFCNLDCFRTFHA